MPVMIKKTLALAGVALSVLATANAQSVKSIITLSGLPEQVAVNYLTNRIYVAVPSFGGPTDTLAVIDGNTDTVIKQISIPTVGYQVAVDVVRDRVYVGGCFNDANNNNVCEIAVVDGLHNKYLSKIPVTTTAGNGIQGLAVNPITGVLYISNASDNVIDIVQPHSKKVNGTISLDGESPASVTIDPFTNQVYVALATDLVDVIDGNTNQITATPNVGTTNQGIAVNWTTGDAFVTNNVFGISTVGVLGASGSVLANVTAGNTPFGLDVDLVTNLAFVTNTSDNTVSVINGKTNTVSATLPVSGTYVAVNPVTEKVYISGQSNVITVLNEQ